MKGIKRYCIIVLIMTFGVICNGFSAQAIDKEFGSIAFQHLSYLSQNIGERVAGTKGEERARDYLFQAFEDFGYDTEIQAFSYTNRGTTVDSANVIAIKRGSLKEEIIIGAHYDSVRGVEGVEDNGSGVGVMLETAERIKDLKIPYTIRFIAFGAEESGLRGSNAYVAKMNASDIANTKAMINLDSLIVGDNMYVYGGLGKKGFVRELALDIGKEIGIGLQTNPGLNPDYPKGTTGDWSDHAPFHQKGIPFGYLESTNWEIGDMDGYTQTEKHGGIWHDPSKDNMRFILSEFPERMERLNSYSHILTKLVLQLAAAEPSGIEHINRLVEYARDEGGITNDGAARALSTHLTAVKHYEDKGSIDKAAKHMKGFVQLLEHQKNDGQISDKAYHILKVDSMALEKKWNK
ncbi:hypothetical protein J6TS1_31060 [Siminovitchia terrae]|uniref:Uncharacterized protein n=1 Tax=Siminovitchia terrae TaxID=1914933 RepID=A0ABQ4KZ64_SIMTE|nr:M28 family peptidase [Siminovitchia terrae]GIN97236.1 hypothetical protein J6TS1_31060 [Siminovitchia terrae]